jgi:hypothetical protein
MSTGHLAPVFWIVTAQALKEIGGQVSSFYLFLSYEIARHFFAWRYNPKRKDQGKGMLEVP